MPPFRQHQIDNTNTRVPSHVVEVTNSQTRLLGQLPSALTPTTMFHLLVYCANQISNDKYTQQRLSIGNMVC
ncbi:hypothetical protein E2C01_092953 [Portunus trituberculatus]|uniref:Uncharacterized protein n=1 Tax=Portunus trituberculatus TaxID=210409 RepID=A0A5B7JS27_PORTR|nr:hypothetical protein [Portunus trituberculatus]